MLKGQPRVTSYKNLNSLVYAILTLKLVTGKDIARPEQHASKNGKNYSLYTHTAKACIVFFKYEVSIFIFDDINTSGMDTAQRKREDID